MKNRTCVFKDKDIVGKPLKDEHGKQVGTITKYDPKTNEIEFELNEDGEDVLALIKAGMRPYVEYVPIIKNKPRKKE